MARTEPTSFIVLFRAILPLGLMNFCPIRQTHPTKIKAALSAFHMEAEFTVQYGFAASGTRTGLGVLLDPVLCGLVSRIFMLLLTVILFARQILVPWNLWCETHFKFTDATAYPLIRRTGSIVDLTTFANAS